MKLLKATLATAVFVASTSAHAVTYDWTWMGTTTSAVGQMSFDDSLLGTGIIYADSIDSFSIEGFINGQTAFNWDLATGSQNNPFKLSFDTDSEVLNFGGYYPTADNSVVWGDDSDDALICGNGSCGFVIDGSYSNFDGIQVSDKTQFSFTRASVSAVPEPSTYALMLGGLGLVGFMAARRRKQA